MSSAVISRVHAEAVVLEEPMAGGLQRTRGMRPRPSPDDFPYLEDASSDPDICLYRDRTVGLLKRYLRLSVEVGRLPSLLGREFFRTRVTSYHASTFEDAVIFVHDVERSLEKLAEFDRELIARMVLEEYSQEETANLLGCWRRTVGRRYPEALDQLSQIFLKGGILNPLRAPPQDRKACQAEESGQSCASAWEQTE
jgi:hypothetical protein